MPDSVSGDRLQGLSLRVPPSNVQAEQALLGAILANNKAFDRVADFLAPEHFADPVHGRIFQAISRRVQAGQLADAVTLKAEFDNTGSLDDVGGVAYLGQLLGAMVGILNAGEYGRAVYDAWLRRQVIEAAEESVHQAFGAEPALDGPAIVSAAADRLLRLAEGRGAGGTARTLGSAVGATIARSEATLRGTAGVGRLDTGIAPIDRLLRGLYPGQLIFLAARSRTGKTPLMAQIARGAAAQIAEESARAVARPGHVHILSLEMTAEDFGAINLAALTDWSADEVQAGQKDERDYEDLLAAQRRLAELPIIVDDPSDLSIDQLGVRTRVVHRSHHTRLILVDFMELLGRSADSKRLTLNEWIPALGYRLKGLAKALNVPIVALRQINKSRDDVEGARPTLRDLPYDGGQAADIVCALHRPELTMPDDPPDTVLGAAGARSEERRREAEAAWHRKRDAARGLAEFGTLKRRFGPTGWAKLRFNGPRMTFEPFNSDYDADIAAQEPPPDLWGRG